MGRGNERASSLPKQLKDLDLSLKTDLYLLDCFGREKPIL